MKQEICMAWRKVLEKEHALSPPGINMQHVGAHLACADVPEDEEVQKKMLVGAMFKPPQKLSTKSPVDGETNQDNHDEQALSYQMLKSTTTTYSAEASSSSVTGPSEWLKKMSIFA